MVAGHISVPDQSINVDQPSQRGISLGFLFSPRLFRKTKIQAILPINYDRGSSNILRVVVVVRRSTITQGIVHACVKWAYALGSEPQSRISGPRTRPRPHVSIVQFACLFISRSHWHRLRSLRLPSPSSSKDCRFPQIRTLSDHSDRRPTHLIRIAPRRQPDMPYGSRCPFFHFSFAFGHCCQSSTTQCNLSPAVQYPGSIIFPFLNSHSLLVAYWFYRITSAINTPTSGLVEDQANRPVPIPISIRVRQLWPNHSPFSSCFACLCGNRGPLRACSFRLCVFSSILLSLIARFCNARHRSTSSSSVPAIVRALTAIAPSIASRVLVDLRTQPRISHLISELTRRFYTYVTLATHPSSQDCERASGISSSDDDVLGHAASWG